MNHTTASKAFYTFHTAFLMTTIIACGPGSCTDSTYTEYYSEKELAEELQAVPKVLTHKDDEGHTLTVTLSYPNGYEGDYLGRGYNDLPTYNSYARDGWANLEEPVPAPLRIALGASELLVPDAHAAIEPNSGNATRLSVAIDIEVVDDQGATLLSRSLDDVDLYYGKGESDWGNAGTDYEFLLLTTPETADTQVQFLFDRRDFSADFTLVPIAPQSYMVKEGEEVLYVLEDPNLEPIGANPFVDMDFIDAGEDMSADM